MRWRTMSVLIGVATAIAMASLATPGAAAVACVQGVAAWDTLRVRSGPGSGFAAIGGIPPSACGVIVRGRCRGVWCPVGYGGLTGWSSARFLDMAARPQAARPSPAQPIAVGASVCVRGLPAQVTLKVRASPTPSGALLYGFHNGSCGVRITGACVAGYCPVAYQGYRGWADSRYLRR